jgi:hypothetical protein
MTLAELLLGLRDYQPRRGTLGMLQRQQIAARPEPQGVLGSGLADALAQWGRGVQDKAAQFAPSAIAQSLVSFPDPRNAMSQPVSDEQKRQIMAEALTRDYMNFAPLGMVRAWHGSPHDIPLGRSFDASKIGTGEGAQAYGHGFYVAENRGVAKDYQKKLTETGGPTGAAAYIIRMHRENALPYAETQASAPNLTPEAKKFADDVVSIIKSGNINKGNTYSLELTHPNPAKEAATPLSPQDFLHWDLPLSQQQHVVKALGKLGIPVNADMTGGELIKGGLLKGLSDSNGVVIRGEDALRSKGIPGIRYLDGGSRGAGQGTYNYVLFDPKLANIVGKE